MNSQSNSVLENESLTKSSEAGNKQDQLYNMQGNEYLQTTTNNDGRHIPWDDDPWADNLFQNIEYDEVCFYYCNCCLYILPALRQKKRRYKS